MNSFLSKLLEKSDIVYKLITILLSISYFFILLFFNYEENGYHRVVPFWILICILIILFFFGNYFHSKQQDPNLGKFLFLNTKFIITLIILLYWLFESGLGKYTYGGPRGSDMVGRINSYYEYTFYNLITLSLSIDLGITIIWLFKNFGFVRLAKTINYFLLIIIFLCFLNYKISFDHGFSSFNLRGVYLYTGLYTFEMRPLPGANIFNYGTIASHGYSGSYIYCDMNNSFTRIYDRGDLEVSEIDEFCKNTKLKPLEEWE